MKTLEKIFDEFQECVRQVDSPYADFWAVEIEYVNELESNRLNVIWLVRFYNGVEYLFRGKRRGDYEWQRLSISELNWHDFERIDD